MIDFAVAEVAGWSLVAVQEGGNVLGAPQSGAPAGSATAPGGAGGNAQQGPGGFGLFMPVLAVMMIFLVISTAMSGRKDKKRRAEMLASIGKKDRVRTIGGMIGTIVETKGDEYLLETDRSSNSRAWVAKSAVAAVIHSASTPATDTASLDAAQDEPVKA